MKRQSGLTLIEVMMTMTLIAIMLAIAVPGFESFRRNNRLTTQTNEIIGALNYTRSEAVKRGEIMRLQAIELDWAKGWQIVDPANLADPPLREGDAITGGHTIVAGATEVNFDPNGFVDVTPTFTVCAKNGLPGRQITITPTGRTAVKRDHICP